ncbi:reverse transcriptase [Klebsormidium nitens]|uniref:Reverse transcriptase n=1 Tax=Klebsormidium nitens TaxID=105231 RepID=A0A1Y1HXI5_KLENI|nr:reverse transcriptase [Klebsormidium nitens]|eukprot:GAQ81226.1 reverse transcriptase [Klebsormidium nitens]
MAGPGDDHSAQETTGMTPEDFAKQAREATLRNEALFSKISQQLSEHATQQAAHLAKQSEKIDQLQSQIQAKTAPKRSDRIGNPEVKKHMEPLEQAQHVISQAKSVFEDHLDGTSPLSQLSEDQVAALKNQCDEGERAISDRMQFLEDWDSEGLEIASEMLRLRDEASKDPAELNLVSRARKSLAEKRKASEEASKPPKEHKTQQYQNPSRGNFQNRGRSPSPSPWFHPPQPILMPAPLPVLPQPSPVPSPIYQSQYFPSNRTPSPAPGLPPPAIPAPVPRAPSPSMTTTEESLHKLADLTDAAEFEGFRDPAKNAAAKESAPKREPYLRHRLRRHVEFWQSFVTSSFVMGILLSGYMLPWLSGPPTEPHRFPNHPSAFEHASFVTDAVSSLAATGTIQPVSDPPFLVSPLGVVPKAEDKLRLILDLRFLNQFLQITKFKDESIRMISELCLPKDLLFTIDLKAGYHHIDIFEPHWKYLGFQWRGQYYVFTQLPFGLAPACYVFTMVMRQLTKSWRARGYCLVHYIDDFFFACRSSAEFARVQACVLADLAAAGFVVSKEKCQLKSSHVVKFLGFVVDTLFGHFRLTALQKSKLHSAIEACFRNPRSVPAKTVARVTGLITSLLLVTGPISGLFSRFLHRALATRSSWYSKVQLDSAALGELLFWKDRLPRFESRDIWRKHSVLRVLFYDAGGQGWGGHLEIGSEQHEAHGSWEAHEVHGVASSTWRELSGLLRLLRAFRPLLIDCTVIARGDALNVFSILSKGGSAKEHLQSICIELFAFCSGQRIELRPEWLPREENARADYLSKVRDVDDFGLFAEAFAFVSARFGPFTVDRFASEHNAKLPRFDASYWCPGAAAANTFIQDWGGEERNYCFPPPNLVAPTLRHARACRARMTLIVLSWRSAPWWPLLCGSVDSGRGFAPFVRQQLYFPAGREVLVPGRALRDRFFGKGVPISDVFALDIDFRAQSIKFVAQSHMELFIPDSKTDQYRRGETIYIARLGGPFCPVSLVQRLLECTCSALLLIRKFSFIAENLEFECGVGVSVTVQGFWRGAKRGAERPRADPGAPGRQPGAPERPGPKPRGTIWPGQGGRPRPRVAAGHPGPEPRGAKAPPGKILLEE